VKSLSKKIATAALATGLAFPGIVATSAAPAAATSGWGGIGTGAVDIMVGPTAAGCVAWGAPGWPCTVWGSGVVIPNQWSTNEVITAYHVVEQVPNDGTSIFIKIPGDTSGDYYKGYVQHVDPVDDLAVLWIFGKNGAAWPTAAPTFKAADVPNGNTSPAVGTHINASGNGNGNSWLFNTGMENNYGKVDNITLQPPLNPYNYTDHEGNQAHLYNLIETDTGCSGGDSGGPMWNDDMPGLVTPYYAAGIVDRFSADGKHCYVIQMQWAVWDMTHLDPR
jgi:S1-C subfamily serine protease